MHDVYFYKDKQGRQPVKEYIDELKTRTDKNSRVLLAKINSYIRYLMIAGKGAGLPYVKPIEGDIWELRPNSERIFFVAWNGDAFVLLHHYRKKSQKTPKQEIARARREYKDLQERGLDDGKTKK